MVAGQLQLSWDEVHAIIKGAMRCSVDQRKAEQVSDIGVDERPWKTAFRAKGHYLIGSTQLPTGVTRLVGPHRELVKVRVGRSEEVRGSVKPKCHARSAGLSAATLTHGGFDTPRPAPDLKNRRQNMRLPDMRLPALGGP